MTEDTELFTMREFRRMPVGPPYYELVCGRLRLRPTPDFRHQVVLGNLLCPLHEHINRRRLGELVLGPSDVELSDVDVLEPDLNFVSKSRLPILTEQGASAAPDLVVEIFTDKTEDFDRGLKREIYGEHGVRELWLVDKLAEEIAVFRFEDSETEPVAVVSGRQKLTTPLLPGLKLALAEVFEE